MFLEHCEDADALRNHVAGPASSAFVADLPELVTGAPALDLFDAELTRL